MREKRRNLFAVLMVMVMLVFTMNGCAKEETPAGEDQAANEEATTDTEPEAEAETEAAEPEAETGDEWAEKAAAAVKASVSEFQPEMNPAGPIPEDLKVAVIPSDGTLQGCVAPCEAIQAICEELNWESTFIDGKGSSDGQNKAILSAISWGADVIVCAAIDPAGVQQGIKAANDAGILICSGSNGLNSPNPQQELGDGEVTFAFDVAPDYAAIGRATAAWIVNDAGNDGHVAVFGDKEFPSCMALEAGLMEGLQESDMTISEVQYFTGAQVGDTLNRQITSYLTQNPDCKYVFLPFDPAAAAAVEGLNQANMTDVKVIGVLGIQQNIEYIRSANIQVATGAYDNNYMGWAVVDQIIRTMNEVELAEPVGEGMPYIVLDQTNLPEEGTNWTALDVYDYASTFKELWK